MADTVGNTESPLLSQATPTQSLNSLESAMGDRASCDPDSGIENSAANPQSRAEYPQKTPVGLDFDTCYARFLDQSTPSTCDNTPEQLVRTSLRSPASVDPVTAVQEFHTHYERFVGYSVDPQWFTNSAADPYRYTAKRRSSGLNLVLRNGVMGIGSLIVTGILGTVLLKAGSDGPQYSYREYSPDLFEQTDFTVQTPSVLDGTIEAYSAPGASESEPTRKVELQSFVPGPTPLDVLRVPRYQVVMPDWTPQINEFAPQTPGTVSNASLPVSSIWNIPEVDSASTVLPVDTPTPSEIGPSVVTPESLDASPQLEPSPVIPPALSATDVVIYNEIAFQPLMNAAPEASEEADLGSRKVFDVEAVKQVEDAEGTEPSANDLLEPEI